MKLKKLKHCIYDILPRKLYTVKFHNLTLLVISDACFVSEWRRFWFCYSSLWFPDRLSWIDLCAAGNAFIRPGCRLHCAKVISWKVILVFSHRNTLPVPAQTRSHGCTAASILTYVWERMSQNCHFNSCESFRKYGAALNKHIYHFYLSANFHPLLLC